VLVALVVTCRRPEVWRTHVSERGGYSIELPGTPESKVDATTHRPQDEDAEGHVRDDALFVAEETWADSGDDGVYRVRWYEVPFDDQLTEREFLMRLIERHKLGAAVVPRWIHLGPYTGIEYDRVEPDMRVEMRSRIFVVEGRVFQMWSSHWLGREDDASTQRFLDSFELRVRPGLKVTYDGVAVARARRP
jgi:hypothetical protein